MDAGLKKQVASTGNPEQEAGVKLMAPLNPS